MLTRVAVKGTVVAGHHVQAGQRVNVPVYAIHRCANRFPDPHVFDPDRFAEERARPDRYSYLPFGAGPRICLGASFAMLEAATVLATLTRAVDFKVLAPERVWPVARLSLRPREGMLMGVTVV